MDHQIRFDDDGLARADIVLEWIPGGGAKARTVKVKIDEKLSNAGED
jgi:5,10-methenyltetrahydromethanopterin hydrogenase